MGDKFSNHETGLNSPATNFYPIAPNNSTDLDPIPRAIYVGIGGNLSVQGLDGEQVDFYNVPDGAVLSIRIKRLMEDLTDSSTPTADKIVALL